MNRSTTILFIVIISIGSLFSLLIGNSLFGESHLWHFIFDIVLLSFLFWVFNEWGWRLPIWRWLKIVEAPVIAGEWEAKIISSYDNHSQIWVAKVYIYQRWLNITVRFVAPDSISNNSAVAFERSPDGKYELRYLYQSIPSGTVDYETEPYLGMTALVYDSANQLSGFYQYYDRINETFIRGQVVFVRN